MGVHPLAPSFRSNEHVSRLDNQILVFFFQFNLLLALAEPSEMCNQTELQFYGLAIWGIYKQFYKNKLVAIIFSMAVIYIMLYSKRYIFCLMMTSGPVLKTPVLLHTWVKTKCIFSPK